MKDKRRDLDHTPWRNADAGRSAAGKRPAVQRRYGGANSASDVHQSAAAGVRDTGHRLPHLDAIQTSFGAHDVTGVRAHVGGRAATASESIGAQAYAMGNHVAFRAAPSMHLAAHEAAHVVQQRAGVSLEGGVGQAGDAYETHADAVADAVVAGRSAEHLLDRMAPGGGSDTDRAVQRKDAPETTATQPTTSAPPTPAQPAKKTTGIRFTANYDEVPGKGKHVVAKRGRKNALWFAPLSIYSDVPDSERKIELTGVVAGTGKSNIGTARVPVTSGTPSFSRGSISPAMRYSSSLAKSFKARVTLDDRFNRRATKQVQSFLNKEMSQLGDIDKVERAAESYLSSKFGYRAPQVSIAANTRDAKEIGMRTFYYRAWNNPAIQMMIHARPAGEATSTWGSTKTKDDGVETESERHGEDAHDKTTVQRRKLVTDTLNDVVKRIDRSRKVVIERLRDKLYDDDKITTKTKHKTARTRITIPDIERKLKRTEKSGVKKKKNWAAKLKGIVGKVKTITKIPIINKLKWVRKIKNWQLELADKGLELFAKTSEVPYRDVEEKETTKGKITTTDKGSGSSKTTTTRDRDLVRKKDFVNVTLSKTSSDWSRFKQHVIREREDYLKVHSSSSRGGSDRIKRHANRSTTVTFSGTTTWKFTKPAIEATVVAGRGEVASSPFTEPKATEEQS